MGLPSIFHACIPRKEILSGELSLDLFATKLSLVVEGNAPQVYQDPFGQVRKFLHDCSFTL